MAIIRPMSEQEQRQRLVPLNASSEESSAPLWVPEHDYLPRQDRSVIRSLRASPGLVGIWDFWCEPTQPASWDILIGPGRAVIDGQVNPLTQGSYVCYAADTVRVPVEPAHPSLRRWDRIVIHVHDQENSIEEGFSWSREVITGEPGTDLLPPEPPNALSIGAIDVRPGAPNVDATFQWAPYDRPGTATISWWNMRRAAANSLLWIYANPHAAFSAPFWTVNVHEMLNIPGGFPGAEGVLVNQYLNVNCWSEVSQTTHHFTMRYIMPGGQVLQHAQDVTQQSGMTMVSMHSSCMFGPGQDIRAEIIHQAGGTSGGSYANGQWKAELFPCPPGTWMHAFQNPDGGWWP